jgi:hypothetical protein
MWILGVIALSRRTWRGPWRRRLFGSLRVCAYASVVAGVSLLFLARQALGSVQEQARQLGRELSPLSDLLDGVTQLRINGELLNVSVTHVRGTTVHAVLDRLEAHCRDNQGPFSRALAGMADSVPDELPRADELRRLLRRAAALRDETPAFGSVLCFTGSPEDATESLEERFEETGDLRALGNLRYVTVRQGDPAQGEGDLVKVTALFTEGAFRLSSLDPPPNSDAPGSDSRVVPRPPSSTRLLSAEAVGSPYSVRLYETRKSPGAVLAFYDDAMKEFHAPVDMSEDPVRAYIKEGKPVLVNVDTDGDRTLVTLSEVGVHDDIPRVLGRR